MSLYDSYINYNDKFFVYMNSSEVEKDDCVEATITTSETTTDCQCCMLGGDYKECDYSLLPMIY